MAKTKTFRVVDGRIHFKCYSCGGKRMVAVPQHVRNRSFRCQKCGELTRCILNRRLDQREQQLGKVLVTTPDDTELEADLADISLYGVGFDIPLRVAKKISVGKEVKFRCPWNPRLLSRGQYIVTSIKGRRVGAKIRR